MICNTYSGHQRSFWPHIISRGSLFHFSHGLLLSVSLLSLTLLAVSSCACLQMYLYVNYYLFVLYSLVGTMGKHKREFPLREQREELLMRLWLCGSESRGRMSASWAPCTQLWAPLVGRRQNQSLWCATIIPSMVRSSRTRCEGVLHHRRCGSWPVAVFFNILLLGWDQWPHHVQGAPAAGESGGAEGRIHGGESGPLRLHKVGSSVSDV